MQAKFKTKTYDCLNVRQSNANDGANTLSLLLSGVESIDELKDEASGCERVEILEDGSVTQVYEDYTNYLALSEGEGTVDVTMAQPSLVKQVAELKKVAQEQAAVIREQNSKIEEQASIIANQEMTIRELQITADELNVTQADQDDAINYLLMGEEE